MNELLELIQKRIAQIEQDQKATTACANELSAAPNYARDEMLIETISKSMAVGNREWIVLKSLLNGGLAAQGGIFPPFGSYLHTDHLGRKSCFSIREFFRRHTTEYARIQHLDGRIEDVSVHFFLACQLTPIETTANHWLNRFYRSDADTCEAHTGDDEGSH